MFGYWSIKKPDLLEADTEYPDIQYPELKKYEYWNIKNPDLPEPDTKYPDTQ